MFLLIEAAKDKKVADTSFNTSHVSINQSNRHHIQTSPLRFNTSHVSINPAGDDSPKFGDAGFNTSHVSINRRHHLFS